MAAKSSKNKARKKKRTAKHVLDAQKKKADGEYAEGTAGAADDTVEGKAPTKAGKKRKEKDPSEAEAYLSAWKHRDSGQGVWKFNKNTQSWLIRNVYEVDRVAKSTFGMLIEYLGGLKGVTRTRVREDAARRALRYKKWEKSKREQGVSGGDEEASGLNSDKEGNDDGALDDVKRWAGLDDHDKRKEYKRARKVLDAIKE